MAKGIKIMQPTAVPVRPMACELLSCSKLHLRSMIQSCQNTVTMEYCEKITPVMARQGTKLMILRAVVQFFE